MAATNAAYNFWLYELCDVYIVRRLPCPQTTQLIALSVPHTGSDEAHDGRGGDC